MTQTLEELEGVLNNATPLFITGSGVLVGDAENGTVTTLIFMAVDGKNYLVTLDRPSALSVGEALLRAADLNEVLPSEESNP
ncbi:MAG: hypothetical protein ABIV36_08075 [Sphingobium limneticum]